MLDKIAGGRKDRSTPVSGQGQSLRETTRVSCGIFFPWKMPCCGVQVLCSDVFVFQWTRLQNYSEKIQNSFCFLGKLLKPGDLGREGCAVGWSVGKSAWGGKPHSHPCMPWPGKHPPQSEMLKISHFLPSMELQKFCNLNIFSWKRNSSFSLRDKSWMLVHALS